MKDKEKAMEIANKQKQYYGNPFYEIRKEYFSAPECFKSAMEMAQWKDEENKEKMIRIYNFVSCYLTPEANEELKIIIDINH